MGVSFYNRIRVHPFIQPLHNCHADAAHSCAPAPKLAGMVVGLPVIVLRIVLAPACEPSFLIKRNLCRLREVTWKFRIRDAVASTETDENRCLVASSSSSCFPGLTGGTPMIYGCNDKVGTRGGYVISANPRRAMYRVVETRTIGRGILETRSGS